MSNLSIDIEKLTSKCMGNQELVASLLDRFQNSLDDYEYEITEINESDDLENIGTIAHRLAGESGTMCALQIHKTAKEIGVACLANSRETLDSLIRQLVTDFANVREYIVEIQKKKSSFHESIKSPFKLTEEAR